MFLDFFFLLSYSEYLSSLAVDSFKSDVENQSGTAGDGTREAARTVAVVAVKMVSGSHE